LDVEKKLAELEEKLKELDEEVKTQVKTRQDRCSKILDP
jgi:flagellar motility protein MotE (MotC chaperone)